MSAAMRPVVLRCRERLAIGRKKAKAQHDSGSTGIHVSNSLTDLFDVIVLDVWNEAIEEFKDDKQAGGLALVAHGGFGRRDVAPFSDVDIMLLTTNASTTLAEKVAGTLTRDLVDAGLQVGFSIRNPSEACKMAWTDAVIFSSLAESRLLAGSLHVYSKFFNNLRHGAMRRNAKLIRAVVAARREERQKWGETNYLLRPNVKRSRGGLRDIQLIRWIGFARYGEADLDRLAKLDALPEEDYRQLRKAYAFMLRLRNELHFREQKSQDVLDRGMQMSIAESWGYQGTEGVLPVEQFMQDYFDNTRNVRYAAAYFADDARSLPLAHRVWEKLLSRRLSDDIRMGPTHIWVPEKHLEEFVGSLAAVLRLMSLANQHRRRISHRTWQAIRLAMQERKPERPDAEAIGAFLSLLRKPGRLAALLRRLHELRIIEQLIPAFGRTRGLLQFNAYHKYTVDAHSIRAVEAATDLEHEATPMGRRYRRQEDKALLHLTLLIHDIGKGYEEDHSIVGARIAKDTAELLGLDKPSAETMEWLVLKHLIVNVVAFRHDLNDPQIVLSFAKEVGSIRRLELLVLHTVADLVAVGPEVATSWKLNLIEQLYKRTRRYFDSGDLPGSDNDPRIEETRVKVREELSQIGASDQTLELIDELPFSLLNRCGADELSKVLLQAGDLLSSDRTTFCKSEFDTEVDAMRYTVVHCEREKPIGTFARATGALSTCGLGILRAQIETVRGELAWDDFWVIDYEFPGRPQEARSEEVCRHVCELLADSDKPIPPYRKTWATQANREPDSVRVLPSKVVFDNETVDRYTILSFFAYDEVGLLYRIAESLAQHNLVLHFAKIDTHLDQVADVFYVSELDGSKIMDERQEEIRESLLRLAPPSS